MYTQRPETGRKLLEDAQEKLTVPQSQGVVFNIALIALENIEQAQLMAKDLDVSLEPIEERALIELALDLISVLGEQAPR